MYAVTGATGELGRKVIAGLCNVVPASEIAAIVRNPQKAEALGVSTRQAEYGDKEALIRAFDGIDKLLLISSSSLTTRQLEHQNVINAAVIAGVRHIVYTSLLHAEQWQVDFKSDHLLTEEWIKASGLEYTLLRNGWYWENNTVRLPAAVQHNVLLGAAGNAQVSWASRQDLADAAVAVLTQSGHTGKTYELAGDEAYTFAEMAAEAAKQSGIPINYVNQTEDEFENSLLYFNLPGPIARIIAEIEARGVATGVLKNDARVLSTLIGHPTTSLQQAVAEALMP
ncbi:SDR family oxidoreductase [Pectobacterium brasiliense]|uniref:SDR family oxidoreductase n=1 Tax=Pectobacterium brasiliense TaxID=180957 RepID=UPI001968F764|nr:SDR family oxidoreductase [Pectobacterium brasiliense]MBN3229313.1 SDR family oxidoreductase [Pectobacterium brasiliense]